MDAQWLRYLWVAFWLTTGSIAPGLLAQDTDLDKYLRGPARSNLENLIQSLNNGVNSGVVQSLHAQKFMDLRLGISNVWVTVGETEQVGPLQNTSGFQFPVAQLELDLPYYLSVIGRGGILHLGESEKEQSYLWGVGVRYTMLDEAPNTRAGMLLTYQEINRLQDFDMHALTIQGYFNHLLANFDLWVAPGVTRNVFDIHLVSESEGAVTFQDSRVNTFFSISTGLHWHLSHRISVTGSVIWGAFTTIGVGGNLKLF